MYENYEKEDKYRIEGEAQNMKITIDG